MPNRLIREGFLDSPRVGNLTQGGENLFHRLLLVSDDAGRFDGRVTVLVSRCWPAKRQDEAEVLGWLAEIIANDLAIAYTCAGKPYLQLRTWQRCGSAAVSKFPWKDGTYRIEYVERETRDGVKEFVRTSLEAANGTCPPSAPHRDGVCTGSAPHADRSSTKTGTGTETETKSETSNDKSKAAAFAAADIEMIYNAYPRKEARGNAIKAIAKALRTIRDRGEADPCGWLLERVKRYAACREGQDRQYTPHPATWFNGERFNDDESAWRPQNGQRNGQSPRNNTIAQEIKIDGRIF